MSDLWRLLNPKSVAVVGASDSRGMSSVAVGQLLDAPVTLHLVNPNAAVAHGRKTVASLADIEGPVDAVLSLVGAARTVEVVEQAAAVGASGVVVAAGGFAEAGADGVAMQQRLGDVARHAGLAIVGPNCTGFANISAGVSLFTGTPVDVRAGGVSIVSSSGYLMRSAMVAASERGLGLNLAISAGNEAVTSLTDYLNFFVDDPQTSVICVIVEKLREPEVFFDVAARARAASKPLIVLKLGRTERARSIVRSHTGALTGQAWLYDVAFRSAGVIAGRDIDDVFDLASVMAQLPPDRWRPVQRAVIVGSSGGVAALASDTVASDDVELPSLDDLVEPIRQYVPGAEIVNPLDLTGFTMADPDAIVSTLRLFDESPDVDATIVCWWIGDNDEDRARTLLEPVRRVAGSKPIIVATLEHSRVGRWTADASTPGIAFCSGITGATRGLRAMREQTRVLPRRSPAQGTIPRPARLIDSDAGQIVPFDDAMRMLERAGVPVAPWWMYDASTWPAMAGSATADGHDRFVVKLADVPHRTELGAVRVGVDRTGVVAAADELRALAHHAGVPDTVVVQAQAKGNGEAFIGIQHGTEVGSVIVVGLGGVFVELTRDVVGRLLPVAAEDVDEMLVEFGDDTVFRGLRGAEPWNRSAIAAAVAAAARFGELTADWLVSMDLNPLICDGSGCTAVDALMIART